MLNCDQGTSKILIRILDQMDVVCVLNAFIWKVRESACVVVVAI
jgi:hypothetical protein